MNTQTILSDSQAHLAGVLRLQSQYHKEAVGIGERGFLTCRFSQQEVERFASELGGVVVALDDEKVVGYNIVMTIQTAMEYLNYRGLIIEYQKLRSNIDTSKVLLARQYCVDEAYRGRTVVKSLYDVMRRDVCIPRGFLLSIGEIDSRNRASLLAAQRILGYTMIGTYTSDDVIWHIGERKENQ